MEHIIGLSLLERLDPARNTPRVILWLKFVLNAIPIKLHSLDEHLSRQPLPCGIRLMALYFLDSEFNRIFLS